jgi:hypothetical protein
MPLAYFLPFPAVGVHKLFLTSFAVEHLEKMSAKRNQARDVKSYAESSDEEEKGFESQESYASGKSSKSTGSTGSKKNTGEVALRRSTRSSSGLSPRSPHTGLSQGFENWGLDENTVVVSDERATSFATVCVAHRASTHKKQKEVKPFVLQNTFYAFPKDISEQDKEAIDTKIKEIVADFETQHYIVERKTFGLPFEAHAICRITPGYNMTAKKVKAHPGQKRKNRDESEDEKDEDAEEAGSSCKKNRN